MVYTTIQDVLDGLGQLADAHRLPTGVPTFGLRQAVRFAVSRHQSEVYADQ
jgi:hypothetical protein